MIVSIFVPVQYSLIVFEYIYKRNMVHSIHEYGCTCALAGVFFERERERDRESVCVLKAQVPGVSMRPPPCTDADDLLSCSATVGNLGERGEPDIIT